MQRVNTLLRHYNINILGIVVGAVITSIYFLCPIVYAETQPLGLVQAVKADPYYFSEGGLGLGILENFQQPLTPYLTSQTPPNATNLEIMQAYQKASANITASVIVSDDNRAKSYVVHFLGAQAQEHVYTTFSMFQPLAVKNPLTPSGMQTYRVGFMLTSLPGKDKKWFYDSVISGYINPSNVPQPIDVNVDTSAGDGTVLQTYQYHHCTVIEYVPYLNENLGLLTFTKQFKAEFRERTVFSCDGFHVDFNLHKQTTPSVFSSPSSDNYIPSQNDTLQKYIVTFSSSNFGKGITYYTFGKFTPVDRNNIQFPGLEDVVALPANLIGGNPKFTLESLPSQDKTAYYNFLYQYINPGRSANAEPTDVKIDLVSGDGNVLQSWKYHRCTATAYTAYRQEIVFIWKFRQTLDPEIRDKAVFSCSGLAVDFVPLRASTYPAMNMSSYVPTNDKRAQVFTVSLYGGILGASKIDNTYLKFQPIVANNPLTPPGLDAVTLGFYLESLPSKSQEPLYRLVGKYVNPGTAPELFDASINLVSGDGSVLQTWKYAKCNVVAYKPFVNENLLIRTFTEKLQPEIRDRTLFQCIGISLGGQQSAANQNGTIMQPINFVPNDNDRAQKFRVTFSNGDMQTPQTYHTFAMFEPEFTSVGRTMAFQIKSSGFTLTDLPSIDKVQLYQFMSRYINPGTTPQLFDVSIDVITGDGTILQTWKYSNCDFSQYKTYLMNNLLLYTMNGRPGISEIRENSEITCGGFALQFGGHADLDQSVPSYDERAIAYVVTGYGGQMTASHTSGLVQQFDTLGTNIHGSPQFQMQLLSSKYNPNGYSLIGQYINPGTKPQLFDMTTDFITGNGTILYSAMYKKCYASDYAIFLDDNMLNMKYTFSMKPEIRDQTILNCGGLGAAILPQQHGTQITGLVRNTITQYAIQINPTIQQATTNSTGSLSCKDDFLLMVRQSLYNAVCVKTSDVSKFIDRGWMVAPQDIQGLSGAILPIIPTSNDRAMSYRVTFQGTDIKTQTFNTFSAFAPIAEPSLNPQPSYQLAGQHPMFALWSMPSKDKQPFYHLVSMYINPGIKPNPFDVTVDIVKGDNSTLQTWKFGKCEFTSYVPFLNQNIIQYKFHMKWQSEIQDISTFACSGLNLIS